MMLSVKGGSCAQHLRLPRRKYYFHIASKCKVYAEIAEFCLAILRPLTAAPFR